MYEMTIERGKIREFAAATYARNPVYMSPDPVVPVTFLTTAQFLWEPSGEADARALGFDLARMLHGREEYVFHGPLPRAGTTLSVSTRLTDQLNKEGSRGGSMRFGTIVHEFRDPSGALVAEQFSTLIETSGNQR